jgi:acetyltransferase-like isoleucine patch superfamily enzyme
MLPWRWRRRLLQSWFGYEIHPTAKIGLAWVFPKELSMAEGAKIDHFTVAINLDRIVMSEKAKIGRSNWITGFPTGTKSLHFAHQQNRRSELLIGAFSAITKHHHIDCTSQIEIGKFVTIAGYYSQLLTHSIDVFENRQDSHSIKIGDYCFVSTNVVILGGSSLPSYSVLGAKALLNKTYTEEWKLYGGVPAKVVKDIPKDAKYFSRKDGFVY